MHGIYNLVNQFNVKHMDMDWSRFLRYQNKGFQNISMLVHMYVININKKDSYAVLDLTIRES
jgi:hypothetical protein